MSSKWPRANCCVRPVPDHPRQDAMNSELHLFNQANFGVIRSDATGQLTYINDWVRALIGKRVKPAVRMRDFVSDPESLKTLEAELQNRLQGEPGEYVFTLDADNGRQVEMQVFGTPIGDANGQPS